MSSSSINWEEMYKRDTDYFWICLENVGQQDKEDILNKICEMYNIDDLKQAYVEELEQQNEMSEDDDFKGMSDMEFFEMIQGFFDNDFMKKYEVEE